MENEKKTDEKLLNQLRVYGEQLKPMAKTMLKTMIQIHNERGKMEQLTTGLMKSLANKKTESADLGIKIGMAIGMITKAHNAVAYASRIQEGALKQIEEWAKDVQRVDDPKVVFRHPGAQQKGRIVTPGQKVVHPHQLKRKGGRIIH